MLSVRSLGLGAFMQVIKTWANSWSTSDRYHEELKLPCIWGCRCFFQCEEDARDELAHYLECPIFWAFLDSCLRVPLSMCFLPADVRACLHTPSRNDFKRIVVAFRSYHAIRSNHRDEVVRAVQSQEFDRMHELLIEHVCTFGRELPLHLVQ